MKKTYTDSSNNHTVASYTYNEKGVVATENIVSSSGDKNTYNYDAYGNPVSGTVTKDNKTVQYAATWQVFYNPKFAEE